MIPAGQAISTCLVNGLVLLCNRQLLLLQPASSNNPCYQRLSVNNFDLKSGVLVPQPNRKIGSLAWSEKLKIWKENIPDLLH
jgi:hypothetical protein